MLKPIEFTLVLCFSTAIRYKIGQGRHHSRLLRPRVAYSPCPSKSTESLRSILSSIAAHRRSSLPDEVYQTLSRGSRSKNRTSVRERPRFTMANGDKIKALKSCIEVDHRRRCNSLQRVVADIAPVSIPPVLGQSFLARLPSWTIDNRLSTHSSSIRKLGKRAGSVISNCQFAAKPKSLPDLGHFARVCQY